MNVDDLINFLMNDLIYDRIIEESMESHLNDIFKKSHIISGFQTKLLSSPNLH